jgi:hypothetical protein
MNHETKELHIAPEHQELLAAFMEKQMASNARRIAAGANPGSSLSEYAVVEDAINSFRLARQLSALRTHNWRWKGNIESLAVYPFDPPYQYPASMWPANRNFVCLEYYGRHQQVLTARDGSITSSGWYDVQSAMRWALERGCSFIDRRTGDSHADDLAFRSRVRPQQNLFEQT